MGWDVRCCGDVCFAGSVFFVEFAGDCLRVELGLFCCWFFLSCAANIYRVPREVSALVLMILKSVRLESGDVFLEFGFCC